jgi:hypothetical protein
MKYLIPLLCFVSTLNAQVPDPSPLESRVTNLEARVSALEQRAATQGVKVNQFNSYAELRDFVSKGNYATIAVGVNAPANLQVASQPGFNYDGVYSMYWDGTQVMTKRFGTSALYQQSTPVAATTNPDVSITSVQPYTYWPTSNTTCVDGQCTTVSTRKKLFSR